MGGREEPPEGCFLDGPIRPFDLPVGPRMVEFRQAMVDLVLGAGEVKTRAPDNADGTRASPESHEHSNPRGVP